MFVPEGDKVRAIAWGRKWLSIYILPCNSVSRNRPSKEHKLHRDKETDQAKLSIRCQLRSSRVCYASEERFIGDWRYGSPRETDGLPI